MDARRERRHGARMLMQNPQPPDAAPARKLGWLRTLSSILASMFGVQSQRRFEEDFNRGSWRRYAVVLVLLMFVYVMLHILVVELILSHSGVQ